MHIITPYNPWAPKKKKTWQEELWEQQTIAEAEARMLAEASSRTLPNNSPNTSMATVGPMANTMAGGGGKPVYAFFSVGSDVVNFDRSPASGDAPVTVNFINLTTTPQFDSYKWRFSDNTTSTDVNPVHIFQSGSTNSTIYTASLEVSNSVTGAPGGRSPDVFIVVGVPSVTASYTYTTTSKVAPFSASFTNTSINTSQTKTTSYVWIIKNDNNTYTSTATDFEVRIDSGSVTASLGMTGSYGLTSLTNSMFKAAAPTLLVSYTVVTSSKYAPANVTLSSSYSYTGIGTLSGLWREGEYQENGTEYVVGYPGAKVIGPEVFNTKSISGGDGKFTSSLAITESIYGITAFYTQSFQLKLPTLELSFVTRSFGNGGIENSYMEPVSMLYTSSIVTEGMYGANYTFLWDFGAASFTNSQGVYAGTATTQGPHFRSDYAPGSYTASLEVTSSIYGLSVRSTQSFVVGS